MYNTGKTFNIQRFSTSDGPGIRTVIFLKGCPLHCTWCHNPESHSAMKEISYQKRMCIACGECVEACPQSAHCISDGMHHFSREKCTGCGKCTEVCYSHALELCGETKTTADILDIVLQDRPFYEESGGGITISGGEPLMQFGFTLSLLKHAKENGLHTAIETCGYSHRDITELNQYTDLWLYDIKLFPDAEHIKQTGKSNKIIFNNLYLLDKIGATIILRCPIIPDINLTEQHFNSLAMLSNHLNNLVAIHLEPYHPLGISKAQQIGKDQPYKNGNFLSPSLLEPFSEMLRQKTGKEVIIS